MARNFFQTDLLITCRYFLNFSYIGTKYQGVQRQTRRSDLGDDDDGTIQSAVEKALNRTLLPVYGSRLALSSRTDSGVHAYMNTANVDLTHPLPGTIYKPSFVTEAVNKVLIFYGHEISVQETRLVPSCFHSRINAKWRSYIYRIAVVRNSDHCDLPQQAQYLLLRPYLPLSQINRCHIISHVDIDLIRKSCEILQGKHDFVLFTTYNKENINKSTEKSIDEFQINQLKQLEAMDKFRTHVDFYEFFIKSESFLYNQVRRMVSAAIDVGLGRITLQQLENMLDRPSDPRPATLSRMAPACGLYLKEIGYDEEDFILSDNFNEYSPRENYDEDSFDEIEE